MGINQIGVELTETHSIGTSPLRATPFPEKNEKEWIKPSQVGVI